MAGKEGAERSRIQLEWVCLLELGFARSCYELREGGVFRVFE